MPQRWFCVSTTTNVIRSHRTTIQTIFMTTASSPSLELKLASNTSKNMFCSVAASIVPTMPKTLKGMSKIRELSAPFAFDPLTGICKHTAIETTCGCGVGLGIDKGRNRTVHIFGQSALFLLTTRIPLSSMFSLTGTFAASRLNKWSALSVTP